jgi:hypothetical protein
VEKGGANADNNIMKSTGGMRLLDALLYVGYSSDHLMNIHGICAATVRTG